MVLVIPVVKSYEINYVDCLHPKSVRTYSAHDLCPATELEPEVKAESYTILQQPTTRQIKGYSCKVRRSMYHFKCGAWGHLKLATVPQILHPLDITVEQCRTMINTRSYRLPGNPTAYRLELNKEVYLELTTKGELVEKDNVVSCTGETVHIGTSLHQNVVRLEEYRFIIQEETFLVSGNQMEAVTDHLSLPCPYTTQGCVTGDATYSWSRFNQVCNLEIVKTIEPRHVLNTYLVDHDRQLLINTTGQTTLPGCPMTLTKTDHPTLFLAKTPEVISLPTVMGNEIDLALQSSIHLNYVSYQLEREFDNQEATTKKRICEENRLKEKSEPTPLKDGSYGTRRGDIYYIFDCQQKTAKIREDTTCWADIPIAEEGFVTPDSRQLVLQSTKIPCSKIFPTVIRTNKGWVEVLPHLKIRPEPLKQLPHSTQPVDHVDYSHGGLYSDQELKEWKHQISFPSYHKALLKSLSYGSCLHDGSCSTTENSDIKRYDLDTLIPNLQNELNIINRFKNFLKTWGDLMAFVCLVIIGIKFLTDLVLITVTTLRAGPAAAAALVASLYLYNRATYQRIMRRHQQKQEQVQQEQVPLHPAQPKA